MNGPHPIVAQLTLERKRRRIKQASVAARAGSSHTALSRRELGDDRPTLDSVTAWAHALGHRLVLVPADVPATRGELAAFLYQLIKQKAPEQPDIPPPPTSTDELFQQLIGALAQLFEEDA